MTACGDALIDHEPGVYLFADGPSLEALMAFAAHRGFRFFRLDGDVASSKDRFLREAAQVMQFPDYYGGNWDAFDECVRDLSWLPANGYVLLFDHFDQLARQDPAAWDTVRTLFDSTVESWREEGKSFYVLLRGRASAAPGLPLLRVA